MPNVKLPPAVSDRLCECGCGQFTQIARVSDRSKGWVRGEGVRFVRGHGVRPANQERTAKARSWTVDKESGCWNWNGALSPLGYGRVGLMENGRQRPVFAYRWVYEQRVGPVPEGLILHHECENPACVNPEHLRPMTRKEHHQLHSILHYQRGEQKGCSPLDISSAGKPIKRRKKKPVLKPFVCPRADCGWEGADEQYEAPCPVHGRNLVPRRADAA